MNKLEIIKIFAVHSILLILVYTGLYTLGYYDLLPDSINIIQWDAGGYEDLKDNGYIFLWDDYSNSGFYPLFSYLWRFTFLGNVGISLLNYLIFLSGIAILIKMIQPSKPMIWLALSMPTLIFMYVPYSEALFFTSCCLLLYGLQYDKFYYLLAGVVLASFTRPTSIFFIPIFIALMVLSGDKQVIKKYLLMIASVIVCYFIVVLWQWYDTGVWFAHYKAQTMIWNRVFNIPKVPFIISLMRKHMWLDLSALWVAVLALLLSVITLINWARKYKWEYNGVVVRFSFFYLSVTFLYLLCYHTPENNTYLTSLNRYIFAVPFFTVVLWKYSLSKPLSAYWLGAIMICTLALWFVIIEEQQNWIYQIVLSFVLFLYLLLNRETARRYLWIPLYLFNVLLQSYIFLAYLHRDWLG